MIKSLPVTPLHALFSESEHEVQQNTQEIVVHRLEHEKWLHEYFSSGVSFTRLVSRGSSILVIMTCPLAQCKG